MVIFTLHLGSGFPCIVITALPRLATGVHHLENFDSIKANSTTILTISVVAADCTATLILIHRVAIVVSEVTALEDAELSHINAVVVVHQESLDSEYTLKIFYALVVPSPGCSVRRRGVFGNNCGFKVTIRSHHDPMQVRPEVGASAWDVGWVIHAPSHLLVTIEKRIKIAIEILDYEGTKVNRNNDRMVIHTECVKAHKIPLTRIDWKVLLHERVLKHPVVYLGSHDGDMIS
mmetsp:Transcript_3000/g.4892  ORF Transcript_3000/g.4892 Transcript_3000/m.4892 type:complete len:233 (-) Transcript_3000:529-1227(-)